MVKWEYKQLFFPHFEEIAAAGLQGWELVAIENGTAWLKREVLPTEKEQLQGLIRALELSRP